MPATFRAAFCATPDGGCIVSVSRGGRVLASVPTSPVGDVLAAFDAALRRARARKAAVREIAIDRGPGGFSSVRRRVAVALALAHGLEASVAACDAMTPDAAATMPSDAFMRERRIAPRYDRPPNITQSRKASPLKKR